MRLIVTRPADDAARLLTRLAGMGHEAILSPVLAIVFRDTATVADRGYQAVALSSANAARAVARHADLGWVLARDCFAVGEQSAQAARVAGFGTVIAGGGDVAQLVEAIAARCDPGRGPVLYLSGAETTGDLEGRLVARGFSAERAVLYDAVPAASLSAEAAAALKDGKADGVLLYSPRSARLWKNLVMTTGLLPAARELRHYCLSHNVAVALGKDYLTVVAAHPDEEALLGLLDPGR